MEKRGAGKWGDGRKDYFIFLYCSHCLKFRSLATSTFMISFFQGEGVMLCPVFLQVKIKLF